MATSNKFPVSRRNRGSDFFHSIQNINSLLSLDLKNGSRFLSLSLTQTLNHLANKPQQTTSALFGLTYPSRTAQRTINIYFRKSRDRKGLPFFRSSHVDVRGEEVRQDHVILDEPSFFNINCHSKIGNLLQGC